jgi:hypothetical protein
MVDYILFITEHTNQHQKKDPRFLEGLMLYF